MSLGEKKQKSVQEKQSENAIKKISFIPFVFLHIQIYFFPHCFDCFFFATAVQITLDYP